MTDIPTPAAVPVPDLRGPRQAPPARRRVWPRVVLALFSLIAVTVIWITNQYLTERFTQTTRDRVDVRMTLYVSNLMSELQRNSIVPQLLARDAELVGALNSGDYSRSTQRLLTFVDEIGAASLLLFDAEGRVVAATDRNRLGESHADAPYVADALRSNTTIFTALPDVTGARSFYYSRSMTEGVTQAGVIAVEVDLAKLERAWAAGQESVLVTDFRGTIIMASQPAWRGLDEAGATVLDAAETPFARALRATRAFAAFDNENDLGGADVLRREMRVPFLGWKMVSFTPYTNVRERVNAVLALEIMGFAILLAFGFFLLNRQTSNRLRLFQRESAELRALNAALQREIAEREKVEQTLQVAEQTLAQSSKLAVLGEMSAAVSHELNQPLAAMKTYLAGARLLLQRKRPEEALSSFQRIDDLIDRMGAITRQLKSYARKGGEAFETFDVRSAVSAALGMMEPQLKTRRVMINRTIPPEPVIVLGDRLRLEQVLINLFRNALDATKDRPDPAIDIILAHGETVNLTVRDNGPGISDLDKLFDPFFTTKAPGDGVGLGLAISSGIVNDLGGRLTARNAGEADNPSGAVFEIQLPAPDTAPVTAAAE